MLETETFKKYEPEEYRPGIHIIDDEELVKAVPDFIDIHYQRFHWFTFNIADIFITIGIFLLIIKEFFFTNEKN